VWAPCAVLVLDRHWPAAQMPTAQGTWTVLYFVLDLLLDLDFGLLLYVFFFVDVVMFFL
jgi:hypothetical protein